MAGRESYQVDCYGREWNLARLIVMAGSGILPG